MISIERKKTCFTRLSRGKNYLISFNSLYPIELGTQGSFAVGVFFLKAGISPDNKKGIAIIPYVQLSDEETMRMRSIRTIRPVFN